VVSLYAKDAWKASVYHATMRVYAPGVLADKWRSQCNLLAQHKWQYAELYVSTPRQPANSFEVAASSLDHIAVGLNDV
jgi:hypothetical protein